MDFGGSTEDSRLCMSWALFEFNEMILMVKKCLYIFTGLIYFFVFTSSANASYLNKVEVREYIDQISKQHYFGAAELRGLFDKISPQLSVLDKISQPAEKRLTWKSYRPIFLKQDRINKGLVFMREHAELLEKAEKEFGVPKEVITAIIGVETKYGRITGKHPVFASVATLAFDYPPRAKFFKKELTEFLLFAAEERFDPLKVVGSYAGAMGMPQFISSSYRQYAIDFDDDGKRDLWNSTADVIGSVANYFKMHHWVKGESIIEKVLPSTSSYKRLLQSGLKPKIDQSDLLALGIKIEGNSNGHVSVMNFEGAEGDEVWVGHHNFYVITRYNHSSLYALAVYQLSDAIKKAAKLSIKTS